MGTKKGHHSYLDRFQKFSMVGSYPHRAHHKSNRLSLNKSGIRAKRESDRIEVLEEEVREAL
jgi:hypothetical protein